VVRVNEVGEHELKETASEKLKTSVSSERSALNDSNLGKIASPVYD
jgi:hypothetical protein